MDGYFGLGAPHARLSDRIGHYNLMMKESYLIKDRVVGELSRVNAGMHDGLSAEELYVPLNMVRA